MQVPTACFLSFSDFFPIFNIYLRILKDSKFRVSIEYLPRESCPKISTDWPLAILTSNSEDQALPANLGRRYIDFLRKVR